MNKICVLAILVFGISGCKPKTPEELAMNSCECIKEAKSYTNTTKKFEKMRQCFNVVQSNLYELQQMGVDNDWSDDQVQQARKKFDKIYDNCNGNSTDSE